MGEETSPARIIVIDLARQSLLLREGPTVLFDAAVSTARNGAGEQFGSECTPRGWHAIRAKIGAGEPPGTVFVGRLPTGEIYSADSARSQGGRDWILTRILWLEGLEPGINCGGDVDTLQRYIYIHGAPDDAPMGIAGSRGCIRMRNSDVIRLFDLVEQGTRVFIQA